MKETTSPIDHAGRIVLPKNIREELAIKPGDVFKVTVHGSSVTLTPTSATAGFIRKGKALVISTGGATLTNDEVNRLLEETRNESVAQAFSGFRERKRRA